MGDFESEWGKEGECAYDAKTASQPAEETELLFEKYGGQYGTDDDR